MSSAFSGFPKDMLKFLKELAANNNREWFAENKPRYETSIAEPMADFIIAMGNKMDKYADCFVADPRRNGGSMFRIYRDTRFSKDKRPYKENVGCHFRHSAGNDAHAPDFYVHIEPKEVFFGAGVWMPSSDVLYKIRTSIVEKDKHWQKIKQNRTLRKYFGDVAGDGLKRPPRGFDPEHPFLEDLKRKSFYLMRSVDPGIIHKPEFINEVNKTFKAASEFSRFITTSLDLPFHSVDS